MHRLRTTDGAAEATTRTNAPATMPSTIWGETEKCETQSRNQCPMGLRKACWSQPSRYLPRDCTHHRQRALTLSIRQAGSAKSVMFQASTNELPPRLKSRIRFHIEVLRKPVLKTNTDKHINSSSGADASMCRPDLKCEGEMLPCCVQCCTGEVNSTPGNLNIIPGSLNSTPGSLNRTTGSLNSTPGSPKRGKSH